MFAFQNFQVGADLRLETRSIFLLKEYWVLSTESSSRLFVFLD